MNLEQQVCSLDLAKKLKELGVKQDSLFFWDEGDGIDNRLEYSPDIPLLELISAFTVTELGEMLPYAVDTSKRTEDDEDKFYCIHPKGIVIIEKNEANARATMLIYLLENKLINQ